MSTEYEESFLWTKEFTIQSLLKIQRYLIRFCDSLEFKIFKNLT